MYNVLLNAMECILVLRHINWIISCVGNSGASSRSGTPTKDGLESGKRKLPPTPELGTSQTVANSKRARLDNFSSAALSPYYNTGNPGSRWDLCCVLLHVAVSAVLIVGSADLFVCMGRVVRRAELLDGRSC
jgi:hypothetical protein